MSRCASGRGDLGNSAITCRTSFVALERAWHRRDGGCIPISGKIGGTIRAGERPPCSGGTLSQGPRRRNSWKTSSLDGNGEHSASDFGEAEAKFAAIAAENVQHSEEIYLLAANSDANVKIRDELLDIKLLEHVDSNGLEQWRPVIK